MPSSFVNIPVCCSILFTTQDVHLCVGWIEEACNYAIVVVCGL